tara:strand:- start:24 stop:425 length:402 start_codon:yes stop_codon:yes gene_type:complete
MILKKNSFAIFSFLFAVVLSSCSPKALEIQGTSQFSTIQSQNNEHQFHTVLNGETLWSISYKYYDDPLLWPNIFKNNKDRIYDADLILPGQSLIIYQIISDESKHKARIHAINRGLWVVGYREETDISFLESN